jgi:hypothetical protein
MAFTASGLAQLRILMTKIRDLLKLDGG